VDFSVNDKKPFFGAAFTDSFIRVWSIEDLIKDGSSLDKPKFKVPGVELGPVDIKFNHLGNRIGVSSLDNSLRIFNIHQDSGVNLYKEVELPGPSGVWKIDFNPNGNEILTGTLSLQTLDITSGTKTNEFNQSKFIHSLAYAPSGLFCACGNIDGIVQIIDLRNFE